VYHSATTPHGYLPAVADPPPGIPSPPGQRPIDLDLRQRAKPRDRMDQADLDGRSPDGKELHQAEELSVLSDGSDPHVLLRIDVRDIDIEVGRDVRLVVRIEVQTHQGDPSRLLEAEREVHLRLVG